MNPEDIDDLPSRPFKGFDCSEHESVTRLIETIYGEYAAWYMGQKPNGRLSNPGKVKDHLKHFVLEAYRTHRAMPGLLLGIYRSNLYYNKSDPDRYHPKHLSYRIVNNVMNYLIDVEHIEMLSKGIWHRDPNKRRTGRYRATDRLIDLCKEHSVNRYMITRCKDPEIIIMHAKRKRRKGKKLPPESIEYQDNHFTKQARKNLEKINEFISGYNINLNITDDQEEVLLQRMQNREEEDRDKFLDFTKTHLRRIFNNDCFKQGGRFYGGWWEEIFS